MKFYTIGEIIKENPKSILKVNQSKGHGKYVFFTSGAKTKFYDNFICDGMNIFIATGGKANISFFNGKASYSTDCYSITTKPFVNPKFLFYFLQTKIKEINNDMFKGAALKHLQKKQFKNIKIKIPSLSDQLNIVAKLDTMLNEVNEAIEAIEINRKNANKLLDRYLLKVFNTNNCKMVKLSTITKEITDGDHQAPPKSSVGVPFITISNVNKTTREIDFSNTYKVPRNYFENLKVNKVPKKGDVLYTVTGSFGIPIHINSDFEFCFQRHIGLIRPSENTNSKWLYWLMLSPQVFKQANEAATGTAQLTVSLKALRNFDVPLVAIKEQKNLAEIIDLYFEKVQKLHQIYNQKLNKYVLLKDLILKQILNGEFFKAA